MQEPIEHYGSAVTPKWVPLLEHIKLSNPWHCEAPNRKVWGDRVKVESVGTQGEKPGNRWSDLLKDLLAKAGNKSNRHSVDLLHGRSPKAY